jgi:hypothetical protein
MPSSGMLHFVALVRTNTSGECSTSVIRVTRICELRTTLAITMMMEVLCSSETLVLTRATRQNIPEDGILHSHHCENLKSYITLYSLEIYWKILDGKQAIEKTCTLIISKGMKKIIFPWIQGTWLWAWVGGGCQKHNKGGRLKQLIFWPLSLFCKQFTGTGHHWLTFPTIFPVVHAKKGKSPPSCCFCSSPHWYRPPVIVWFAHCFISGAH